MSANYADLVVLSSALRAEGNPHALGSPAEWARVYRALGERAKADQLDALPP